MPIEVWNGAGEGGALAKDLGAQQIMNLDTYGARIASAPTLSVLIVSWNDWPELSRCLASLFEQNLPSTEVIVIDNASTDGTPNRTREKYSQVSLHCFKRNIGHTNAVNRGFCLARGEFVLLLDSDTVLIGDCIPELMNFFQERLDIYLSAPRTLNTDGSVQETARNLPTALTGLFGRRSMLTRLFPNNPVSRRYLARRHLSSTEPFAVEQVGAACMFLRRELLEKIGLWDERYFGYWADTDWCCRMKAQGLPIFCVPSARIIHHERNAPGRRKSARRIWLFHYGAWQLYMRWHTFGPWDPRAILAGVALFTRAAMQMVWNIAAKRNKPHAGPLEQRVPNSPRAGDSCGD